LRTSAPGAYLPAVSASGTCAYRRATRAARRLADKAERLLRNLARRLDQEAPSVAASILEGLDEMLTVVRLKLPTPLRRSLACTNAIENMMGTVRRVSKWGKVIRAARLAHSSTCTCIIVFFLAGLFPR
jgi:putative transposase